MRHGVPIDQYPLNSKFSVSTGIEFSSEFFEWEACVAAGLDIWKWNNGYYPPIFRAKAITWHKNHILIDTHQREAEAIKAEQDAKTK